ncbi:MAG: tetratricopeptide repeat protein, partial [Alphaproteobacteria bacterium]|nr:tetratricopeptide repeat protein [Alphaproteobacteria bacterium]
LGKMYRDGRGVAADQPQAAKWFRFAAEQGYAKAQNKLAVIYFKGRGVEADGVEALKWAILAARQGHREAKENRALLKKRLSAEQISKAEQLADLF